MFAAALVGCQDGDDVTDSGGGSGSETTPGTGSTAQGSGSDSGDGDSATSTSGGTGATSGGSTTSDMTTAIATDTVGVTSGGGSSGIGSTGGHAGTTGTTGGAEGRCTIHDDCGPTEACVHPGVDISPPEACETNAGTCYAGGREAPDFTACEAGCPGQECSFEVGDATCIGCYDFPPPPYSCPPRPDLTRLV